MTPSRYRSLALPPHRIHPIVLIGLAYNVRTSTGVGDEEEEFDSPATIDALARTLEELGYQVLLLGDGEPLLRKLLDGPRPDLVLNIAEGKGSSRSREARVPAVLEMLGIPHTGSDPLSLAVTLDKDCAKRLAQAAGVATPRWFLVEDGSLPPHQARLTEFDWPLIVKPAYEGSSKGVLFSSLVQSQEELEEAVRRLYEAYRQPILVEEFIHGDELTVGVLGNRPPEVLGIMRIVPTQTDAPFVYSLEVKRDWEQRVRYECPARIDPADAESVRQAALKAFHALGCQDVARLDFRLRNHVPYFLEANPLPGLAPGYGDLVLLAGLMGVEHRQLIARIVQAAIDRLECAAASVPGC